MVLCVTQGPCHSRLRGGNCGDQTRFQARSGSLLCFWSEPLKKKRLQTNMWIRWQLTKAEDCTEKKKIYICIELFIIFLIFPLTSASLCALSAHLGLCHDSYLAVPWWGCVSGGNRISHRSQLFPSDRRRQFGRVRMITTNVCHRQFRRRHHSSFRPCRQNNRCEMMSEMLQTHICRLKYCNFRFWNKRSNVPQHMNVMMEDWDVWVRKKKLHAIPLYFVKAVYFTLEDGINTL